MKQLGADGDLPIIAGPARGDFVIPAEAGDAEESADALPQQEEFWRPPVRFGSVPVEKEPLGWGIGARASASSSRLSICRFRW